MCASAAAGSMRIMLMPVDAWKTIKQVCFSNSHFPHRCKQLPQLQCAHTLACQQVMLIFLVQVHGADGLKVLSAKAASISR